MDNQTKKCCRCLKDQPFENFNKCITGKLGLYNYCKQCNHITKKIYYQNNAAKLKAHKRLPHIREREKLLRRERYKNDSDYREKELERNRVRRRKEPAKEKIRLNYQFRKATDVQYKLKKICKDRLRNAIKRLKIKLNIDIQKCAKTHELLGCSIDELKKHIESQWQKNMTWNNHGFGNENWHIDHIKPCSSFDLTKPDQQKACFHYTNLQPLWQIDNLSKGDKFFDI